MSKIEILQDTFRVANPVKSNAEGTFNGFEGKTAGSRIDWIGVSSALKIVEAKIVFSNDKGRYRSDHFPVTTIVRFAEANAN